MSVEFETCSWFDNIQVLDLNAMRKSTYCYMYQYYFYVKKPLISGTQGSRKLPVSNHPQQSAPTNFSLNKGTANGWRRLIITIGYRGAGEFKIIVHLVRAWKTMSRNLKIFSYSKLPCTAFLVLTWNGTFILCWKFRWPHSALFSMWPSHHMEQTAFK